MIILLEYLRKAIAANVLIMGSVVLLTVNGCNDENSSEVSINNAISIATSIATKEHYNTTNCDIEILKVKKGLERGPVRLAWLVRNFPPNERGLILSSDFWIIFFYPKGSIEKFDVLGGTFCVLVDLHSGRVIASFKEM